MGRARCPGLGRSRRRSGVGMSAKEQVLRRLRRYAGTDWVAAKVAPLEARVAALEASAGEHERELRIRTVMEWVSLATVPEGPLVSVIMPTRDRARFVRRAYDSLAAQTYGHWELLVVDDGSVDDTRAVVGAIDDDRVRLCTGTGVGACGARNIGLDHVKGEVVAYLDDDNVMHPDWLKAVGVGVGGASRGRRRLRGVHHRRPLRVDGRAAGGLPHLVFAPYEHSQVAYSMVSDMSAIAHRAGIDARFDESLREMGDWDLLLHMTKDKPPLALPFLACRVHDRCARPAHVRPDLRRGLATVRARHRR